MKTAPLPPANFGGFGGFKAWTPPPAPAPPPPPAPEFRAPQEELSSILEETSSDLASRPTTAGGSRPSTAGPPQDQWYVAAESSAHGPLTTAQLAATALPADALYTTDGLGAWRPLAELPALAAAIDAARAAAGLPSLEESSERAVVDAEERLRREVAAARAASEAPRTLGEARARRRRPTSAPPTTSTRRRWSGT